MPPEKSERFPCKAQNCENEGIIPSKDDNDIFLCRFKSDVRANCKGLCQLHINKYVNFFKANQKNCCNPFNDHPSSVKPQKYVDLDYALKYGIITGVKVCKRCHQRYKDIFVSSIYFNPCLAQLVM